MVVKKENEYAIEKANDEFGKPAEEKNGGYDIEKEGQGEDDFGGYEEGGDEDDQDDNQD